MFTHIVNCCLFTRVMQHSLQAKPCAAVLQNEGNSMVWTEGTEGARQGERHKYCQLKALQGLGYGQAEAAVTLTLCVVPLHGHIHYISQVEALLPVSVLCARA